MSAIAYPVARGPFGAVRVEDAKRGTRYTCFGCGGEMVPKLGQINAHHFAHKGDLRCSRHDAVAETAAHAIATGFNSAVKHNRNYHVERTCSQCNNVVSMNAAVSGWDAEAVCDGNRHNVVITGPKGESVRIEILGSDNENGRSDGIDRILCIRPRWDSLGDFLDGISADCWDGSSGHVCHKCSTVFQADMPDGGVPSLAGRLSGIIESLRCGAVPHDCWSEDRFGDEIYPGAGSDVRRSALRLAALGLVQHNRSKPWLFRLKIPSGHLYADLGGTDSNPIWNDPSVIVYCFSDDDSLDKDAVEEEFAGILESHGIPSKIGYYSRSGQ